jgi:DNA processing protein
MEDTKYWVGFSSIPGIGRARFSQLIAHFGDLESAWHATPSELRAAGLDERSVQVVITRRASISLDAEMEKLERYHVKALTWNDHQFPPRLKQIYDAPPVLYIRGNLVPEDEWSIAVVGTRHATMYGREVTEHIANELARSGITIISGLARGVDTIAHRSALEAGGRTIAVFGCGLDIVYPAENLKLAQAIMEHGALVSDYPLGTKPKAENFPRRNRIMSGLSLGVLVTEAGKSSGALLTANLALEQNREVFAIPGSILSPTCRGTNHLIQNGAKLVLDANDILEELNLTMVPQQLEMKELIPSDEIEAQLLRQLSPEPAHIDELCHSSGLPISVISSTLALMELKGMVRHLGNMNYVLARETSAGYRYGEEKPKS